jgi:hypothetical protein
MTDDWALELSIDIAMIPTSTCYPTIALSGAKHIFVPNPVHLPQMIFRERDFGAMGPYLHMRLIIIVPLLHNIVLLSCARWI